jgi:hypothetical protein
MFTFAILFDDGFALAATCREVASIINRESGALVKGLPSWEVAYVYACNKYIDREF